MDNTQWGNPEIPGENPYAAHANPAQATDRASADPLAPRSEPRGLLRRLLARGFQIFLLSMVLFIPVEYLVWRSFEPTYEAFSLLQVEPFPPKLYSDREQDNVDFRSVVPYLQTQVKLMTSDRVLEPVVTNSSVAKFPVITKSQDPKADLRKKMDIEIQEDSYLIRVALELPNGVHAAQIVNAVVDSYLSYNKDYKHGANAQLKANLQLQLEKLKNELKTKSGDLQALHQKGTVDVAAHSVKVGEARNNGDEPQPMFISLTEDRVQTIIDEAIKTDLGYLDALAQLAAVLAVRKQSQVATDERLQTRIAEEFFKDPKVFALIGKVTNSRHQCEDAIEDAAMLDDEIILAAQGKYHRLMNEYEELWLATYPRVRQRLIDEDHGVLSDEKLREREVAVESAIRKRIYYAGYIEKLKIEKKDVNTDTFQFTLLKYELQSLLDKREKVTANLAQLDFESEQDNFRVVQVHPASEPKFAVNNNLLNAMSAAPIGIFFLVAGLFLMREIIGGPAPRQAQS